VVVFKYMVMYVMQRKEEEYMRKNPSTQFGIDAETKDALDSYKAENKDRIIRHLGLRRRLVTNDAVIRYLLDRSVKKQNKVKL